MQNDIHLEDTKKIVANGAKFLCEGANIAGFLKVAKAMMMQGAV